VRLATFNVENLFSRAKALNAGAPGEPNPVLSAFERFNAVSTKLVYESADEAVMVEDLTTLKVLVKTTSGHLRMNPQPFTAWALLRENRGDFMKQPASGSVEIVARGRNDWIGWVELITEPVDAVGIHMVARLIEDVRADILALVEAENRPALVRFNDDLLNRQYEHIMLIDGNDERGIDVGLLTTTGIDIASIKSHVDLPDPERPGKRLFSRDCPVFRLGTEGKELWVLVNHLKSQSFTVGDPDPLRRRQANQVRAIYDQLKEDGAELVAIVGDFNRGPTSDDSPQHPTLEALLGPDSPLVDAHTIDVFDPGPRPGTFQSCSTRNRLDYILVSPELADLVTGGGINRKGLWGNPSNKNPPKDWTVFPPITESVHAASDHAAVWIDFNL
jgi:endonuclease/exonuclease/phosphatase family metal-dependent hydrolase